MKDKNFEYMALKLPSSELPYSVKSQTRKNTTDLRHSLLSTSSFGFSNLKSQHLDKF